MYTYNISRVLKASIIYGSSFCFRNLKSQFVNKLRKQKTVPLFFSEGLCISQIPFIHFYAGIIVFVLSSIPSFDLSLFRSFQLFVPGFWNFRPLFSVLFRVLRVTVLYRTTTPHTITLHYPNTKQTHKTNTQNKTHSPLQYSHTHRMIALLLALSNMHACTVYMYARPAIFCTIVQPHHFVSVIKTQHLVIYSNCFSSFVGKHSCCFFLSLFMFFLEIT